MVKKMRRRYASLKSRKPVSNVPPAVVPCTEPGVKYYSCSYINSETGIKHEILNIRGGDGIDVLAKISSRCALENRMQAGSDGTAVDSLRLWEQGGVVVRDFAVLNIPVLA
jgi:hypothetical protein